MSRLRVRPLLTAAAVLLVVAAAVYALAPGAGSDAVPTAQVERVDFARWVPAEGQLEAVESTPLQVPPAVRRPLRIAWLAPEGTSLAPGEVAVRFDPTELERTAADRRADLESNRLKVRQRLDQAASRRQNLERQVANARRDLRHAEEFESKDPAIFSRVEIVESQLDRELAAERLAHAEQELRREQELAQAEVRILEIERRRIQAELETALDSLEALELRSPAAGHLVYRRNRGRPPEVGNTVFPGQTVAEIPHPGAMRVQAYVLEADAGGLEAGRPARIYPESRPGISYPATVGRVEKVAKPRFQASPVQYFNVTLALEEIDPEVMKPGLGVRAEILLDELEDALTVPRQAIFDRDEEPAGRVVFRRAGDRFEAVPVTLRASGRGRVAVEGALEAGDRVALADPLAERPGGRAPESPTSANGGPGSPAAPAAGVAGR